MEEGKNVSANDKKQDESFDERTRNFDVKFVPEEEAAHNNSCTFLLNVNDDTRDITNVKTATFMDLFTEIRRIVFKKLDLSSKYNLSLIWKDMADEFWRNVDVEKKLSEINNFDRHTIYNLEDLEYAGVLASAGYITQVDYLSLFKVDVSSIPVNIIINLAKIVKKRIYLVFVKGWRKSMLNDAYCERLIILHMMLDSDSQAAKRPIKILDVTLEDVTGDLHGFIESLTYGPVDPISSRSLVMQNMNVSKVPAPVLNNFFKTFRFEVNLRGITGISSQLFSGINCKFFALTDIELQVLEDSEVIRHNMNIENLYLSNVDGDLFSVFENIQHFRELHLERIESLLPTNINMTEILKDKVKRLYLNFSSLPEWLKQYDGHGRCVLVKIPYSYDESYESWARERGWKIIPDMYYKLFRRPQ